MNNGREKIVLTEEQARSILFENGFTNSFGNWEEFETISDEITGNSRWSLQHDLVVKRTSDGKFFNTYYEEGATEQQDQAPFEYGGDVTFSQVFPVQKIITVYE